MMQVVHQDDVVWALCAALNSGVRGIFNIGGPPPVSLSRALQMLERTAVGVPHGVARAAMDRLFRWRVTSFPAPELDFIRYVCMVDDTRARSVLGYQPQHTLLETLRAVDEERFS
jgi:UDP-glucose 4-epimerase